MTLKPVVQGAAAFLSQILRNATKRCLTRPWLRRRIHGRGVGQLLESLWDKYL